MKPGLRTALYDFLLAVARDKELTESGEFWDLKNDAEKHIVDSPHDIVMSVRKTIMDEQKDDVNLRDELTHRPPAKGGTGAPIKLITPAQQGESKKVEDI